jgi:hypothetical protein
MAQSQPQQFLINERVLCYHGPLIYEAKILKAEVWDELSTLTGITGPHFYVHYKGWKQTYVHRPSLSASVHRAHESHRPSWYHVSIRTHA